MATAEHEPVTPEPAGSPAGDTHAVDTEPKVANKRNTEIWDAVCKTDPAKTKKFTRSGGFAGTAINQTYQMQRATALWGPVGVDWGWKEVETKIVEGDGQQIWFTKVELWYPFHGKTGHVEHWGATTFVGKNKYGVVVDEEAAKKSVTDAVGKCLAMLGFSADVYLGLFDDNKYVNDLKAQLAAEAAGQQQQNAGAQSGHARNGNGQQQNGAPQNGNQQQQRPANQQGNQQQGRSAQHNALRLAAKAIAEAETVDRVQEIMKKARAVERGLTQPQIDEIDGEGKRRIGELQRRN